MSERDFELAAVNNGSSPNRALRSLLVFGGVGLLTVAGLASDRGGATALPAAAGTEQGPSDGIEQGDVQFGDVTGRCVTETAFRVNGSVTGEGTDQVITAFVAYEEVGNVAVGPQISVSAGDSFEYDGDIGELNQVSFIEILLSTSDFLIVHDQALPTIDWSLCTDEVAPPSSSSVPPSSSSVPPSSSSVPPSSSSSSSSSSSVPIGGGGDGGNAGGEGEGGGDDNRGVTSSVTTTTVFVNGLPVTG